ncbi:hypothetical protein [Marinoscillum sp. 108]|uniref:hypothetical protein n=1 Tax=Marinoscillum sp. 108 TaxID=2653151 RepID=UPI0012EF1C8E|nr:hypothetical protein [Marinoscillum sp. 108]VXD14814.1 hypothetical protein MARINOS108_12137 [Marinoscillum sp. 108]
MKVLERYLRKECLGLSIEDSPDGLEVKGALVWIDAEGEICMGEALEGTESILQYILQRPVLPISLGVYSEQILSAFTEDELTPEGIEKVFSEEVTNEDQGEFLINFMGSAYAFARKDSLLKLLYPLEPYKDQLVGVHLGLLNEYPLARSIHSRTTNSRVAIGRFEFDFSGNRPAGQKEVPSDLQFGDTLIDQNLVPPFCAALNALNGLGETTGYPELQHNQKDLKFKKVYLSLRYPVLGVLLALFLINATLFVFLNDTNKELRGKSSMIERLGAKQKQLQAYLLSNKDLLSDMEGKPEIAQICDMVGKSIPKALVLEQLLINPPSDRPGKKTQPPNPRVVISGKADDPIDFTHWVHQVEQMDWVEDVIFQRFQGPDLSNEQGRFNLILSRNVE